MLYTTFMVIFGTLPFHSVSGYRLAFPNKFWRAAAPGKLLETLDLMTSDAVPIYTALSPAKVTERKTQATGKKAAIHARDDDVNASYSEENPNFDQAYEQFVRNYFSKRSQPTSEEETSALSAEPLSLEVKNSASTEMERKSSKQQHCKKIRKDKQDCVICRNPKNNEKSETCAYSTETKPLQYAYEEQKNYKMSRKSPKEKDDDETEQVSGSEETSSEETQAKSKYKKPSQKREEASSCVKTTHAHKICYHCENVERGTFTKCYAKYAGESNSKSKIKAKGHQTQQHKQRIQKRTISYSYFNKKGN